MNTPSLLQRIYELFRKARVEEELDEEIQTHIEMATEENLRRGMNFEDARRAARRSFGGVEQMKEVHRDFRGVPLLETVVADFRFAARSLRRSPAFAVTTVATLVLGISACTTVFGVMNAVLLKPLPYPAPEQLVFVGGTLRDGPTSISPPDFLDFRQQNQTLTQLAAAGGRAPMTLTGIGAAARVQAVRVSGNFFDVFGIKPQIGRAFNLSDEQGAAVAVISHALWQNRYAGRSDIVGQNLRLDSKLFMIAGVMPPAFDFPARPDIWLPLDFTLPDLQNRGAHQLSLAGRLRDGVTWQTARQDLSVIAARLEKAYPGTNTGFGIRIRPLHQELVGPLDGALVILLAAVSLLLLLACANVANLVLARGTARMHEISTRLALGAGRGRLVRLLVSESLLLSLVAGAAAALLSSWVISRIAALGFDGMNGSRMPGLSDATVDARVLGFTFLVALVTTVITGLFPAFSTVRAGAMDSLRSSSRVLGRRQGLLASRGLVIFEVAVSLMLLAGAALVFRSFLNVMRVDPGFNPDGMLTLQVNAQVTNEEQRRTRLAGLLDVVRQIPGVDSAALISELPLSGFSQQLFFNIEGHDIASPDEQPIAGYQRVSSDYFRTMEIAVHRGRVFTSDEIARKAQVAVIDERVVKMYFKDSEPLGQHLVYNSVPYEVVGVVGDVLQFALFQEAFPFAAFGTVYVPDIQTPNNVATLVVRANGFAANIVKPLRDTVQRFDKDLPVDDIESYDEIISSGMLLPRFGTALLTAFSAIGTVLAIVGLYGLLAFATARRTSEIGIRMALGSTTRDVLKLIVSDGMRLSLTGVVVGLAAAYGFTRLLSVVLVRVKAGDPVTLATVSMLMIAAAFCASYIPARRAARIDPVRALRHE